MNNVNEHCKNTFTTSAILEKKTNISEHHASNGQCLASYDNKMLQLIM